MALEQLDVRIPKQNHKEDKKKKKHQNFDLHLILNAIHVKTRTVKLLEDMEGFLWS